MRQICLAIVVVCASSSGYSSEGRIEGPAAVRHTKVLVHSILKKIGVCFPQLGNIILRDTVAVRHTKGVDLTPDMRQLPCLRHWLDVTQARSSPINVTYFRPTLARGSVWTEHENFFGNLFAMQGKNGSSHISTSRVARQGQIVRLHKVELNAKGNLSIQRFNERLGLSLAISRLKRVSDHDEPMYFVRWAYGQRNREARLPVMNLDRPIREGDEVGTAADLNALLHALTISQRGSQFWQPPAP